jgi:hypothetical protein
MFLGDLTWPRNIRTHLMFLDLADVHKLCTLVFKPRNVILVMNIGPEEYKKAKEGMLFSCSVRPPDQPIAQQGIHTGGHSEAR